MDTTINIWIVLIILAIHWFADFVMQTDMQAKNKSTDNEYLLEHTLTYCSIWMIASSAVVLASFYNGNLNMQLILNLFFFTCITFVLHTITDYITSRINSKLWAEGKTHEFFVSIGFDQLLHFTQLLLTYQLLF